MIVLLTASFLVSFNLLAQDGDTRTLDATTKQDAHSVNIPKDVLASHGFTVDDRQLPICEISGSEGNCKVQAFVMGEKQVDKAGYTCSKLDKASYIGHCTHGKLDGLSLVIADGSTKSTREAFISYFQDGRITYPALTSYLTEDKNFGVQEQRQSFGCVYFGKWDKSVERCGRFIEIYGADIFTESNAQKLNDGTFDLDSYRAKFLEFMQRK